MPRRSLQHRRSLTDRFAKAEEGGGSIRKIENIDCFLYSLLSFLPLKVQDSGQGGVFV